MSQQYDDYLQEHKRNVIKGYLWIQANIPNIFNDWDDTSKSNLDHQITYAHDAPKDSPEEYDAYDKYFYGNNKSFKVVSDFNFAWLHHVHNNPHHWQYWVLINDDSGEGTKVLEMPYNYLIEMVCDWWSFSWGSGNLYEIFDWYNKRSEYMKLGTDTRRYVDRLLLLMRTKLDKQENDKNEETN